MVSLVRATGRGGLLLAVLIALSCGDGAMSPTVAPIQPSGFFPSDGLQIYYESFGERGDEDPLILVHGWGVGFHFNWVVPGWVDLLRADRQVIALDVRGHGASDKPHRRELYSYAAMARDVLNLMDHFGIERADYMGYSLGSFSGVYLLGHHGDRFGAMIFGGIGDETPESIASAEVIAAALRAERPEDIPDAEGRGWRDLVDLDPRNDREALALAALQMWPEGFPRELGGAGLASATNPVLIVNGSEDFPYVETDEALVAALPNARLVRLPGQDHLSAVFDPQFQVAVTAFLRDLG